MAHNSSTIRSADSSSNSNSGKTLALAEIKRLTYSIYHYSSFSTNYCPENILVDCPGDQTSRWSAHTNNPPQYLTLKLKRPAIVKKIKFGKFEKSHVCNLKKFRIYGGLEDKRMSVLLEGGLRNDHVPEVFNLRCVTEDGTENLPILYIKIMPLLSWGPTFNFSIWYVELHGQDDPMFTSASMKNYNMLREVEIVKLCLKHFRQQGYENAFKALQEQTQVRLEHPLIAELHKCLVLNGDFVKVEELLANCVEEGFMDDYLLRQDYKHNWRLQETPSELEPSNRGGHQLVLDTKNRLIYLYGGWDGFQDLSDLWLYDIERNYWSILQKNTEECNGPTARSCHKMVFDPISENIFMLGRYLDNSIRTTNYVKSDFYLYDTRARTWLQICDDTSQVGGPQLVYDHQMCLDTEKRIIYVFGGKILTPRSVTNATSSEPEYSGLFSYHIATNTWNQILVDCHHPTASQADVMSIKSRITHCMVFHNTNRKLYIYGGQRGKEDIEDFISYDVDTQVITTLNKEYYCSNGCGANGVGIGEAKNEPSPGYTLRATIDCARNEIYVFSSLSKLKDRRDIHQLVDTYNSFWVYSLPQNKWTRIYTCRHSPENCYVFDYRRDPTEPCPRYAHQLIYDEDTKLHYLFGGNPGKFTLPQLRLDDFWILRLEKPKREEILRYCFYLVRKLHYEEMVRFDPIKAMDYLRKHVAEVIDHTNPDQLNNFHKLAGLIFKTEEGTIERPVMVTPALGKILRIDSPVDLNKSLNQTAANEVVDAALTHTGEELVRKFDCEPTNAADELSIESCESTTGSTGSSSSISSGVSDAVLYTQYVKHGGKRALPDYLYELKSRRAYLFNRLAQLMPAHMVQPERNLSDFVVM